VDAILARLGELDWKRIVALAERVWRKEDLHEIVLATALRWASDELRRKAQLGPQRLAALVEVCDKVALAAREASIFNLDRRPLILSMFGDLAAAAGRIG
jgi:DNA polymerase-3 subunit delta'